MKTLFSPRWLPPVTEQGRTRSGGHEITQTNHQYTEGFFWWISSVVFGSFNATSQDARHTQSGCKAHTHIHFISTSPARLNTFVFLPHSQTLQGSQGQCPEKALQKAHKPGSAAWYTECPGGACPGHLGRRQAAPRELLMLEKSQQSSHCTPSL